jgi:tetrapyrrole methylase family protein/MazG family protein
VNGALIKFQEEVEELVQSDRQEDKFEETGDLIFALVNIARLERIEPEQALQAANNKFARRFHYIEQELDASGRSFEEMSLAELDLIWDEAKARGL